MHTAFTLIATIALAWGCFAAVDAVRDMPRHVEGVR